MWKGGIGTNSEIDLLQNIRNKDMRKQTTIMGTRKTNKPIDRFSRSSGGDRKTVSNFDHRVNRGVHSSIGVHSSSVDKGKMLADR